MRAKISILFIFVSFSLFGVETISSDSISEPKLIFKSDFMNQHLWRGYAMCDVPSVEPTLELSGKYVKVGVWSALSMDGKYFEVDTYIKIFYRGFSFGIYDYYCPGTISSNHSFFNYTQYSTKHTIDLHLEYEGNSNFPFKAMLATMVYGDDINAETNKNFYSTYLEVAYFSTISKVQLDYFLGFNLFESYYGNKPSIINAGVKSAGKINLFRQKQVNLQASIVANPLTNRVYLVFGFGL